MQNKSQGTSKAGEKKVILTKKRLKALEMAISIDDILYEKFNRLHKNLHEYEKQTMRRLKMRSNYRVIRKQGDIQYVEQVKDVISTDDGTLIII